MLTTLPGYAFPAPLDREFRTCVRLHRAALQAQRTLWAALLHDTLSLASLQGACTAMEAAEKRAGTAYKR